MWNSYLYSDLDVDNNMSVKMQAILECRERMDREKKDKAMAFGVGGNLTLAKIVFAEGHVGLVGEAMGTRGFAGVSLEQLMKKGLDLPFNVLVGAEGFLSTQLATIGGNGSGTYWGGLAFRIDYSL